MSVVTVGDFDGVHLGHRFLLRRVVSCAKDRGVPSVAITFDRNCKAFLKQQSNLYLTDTEEKSALILGEGIQRMEVLRFNEQLSQLSAEEFLLFLKEHYQCTDLVGGSDFRFGKGGKGVLREGTVVCGIRQHVVELKTDLVKISSSEIRNALFDGCIEQANDWLGSPYSLCGTVVEGKHLGRTIGFPTLNLIAPEGKVLPGNGVYVTEVMIENTLYRAMTNIGVRPTVEKRASRNVETYLLNAGGDFYGKKIMVRFLARLREERRFADLGALMQQLRADRDSALLWHNSSHFL